MINKTKKQKAPVKNRVNINIKNRAKSKPLKVSKKKDSLIPLLIILIILLALTSFIAFSDKSSVLSDLFSKNSNEAPLIERPKVEQGDLEKPAENEENTFIVTTEVEVKADPEEITLESPEPEDEQKTMKSRLFYVKVSDDGQISLKSVIRTVSFVSTPLTETMKSLISGPERSELNKGLLNLIPKNTELLSIKISQGIAYLNFNEEFRFNSLGIEGYKAQLMQTVYTATEFQSVDKIQILINGELSDYLGAEGVFIGEPIDRDYFNSF